MTSTPAIRTPLTAEPALALGNRRFRKQVLKVGDLHYDGSKFPITDQYLDDVVRAFDAKAITSVPFQLADHANRHSQDPDRRRGTVTALHRTPAGLDAVIELNDAGAAIVDEHPDFGVSVLIKHDRTTGEGTHHPAVLAHVLGTTDPVLTSLQPWAEEIAASNGDGDVLDLLALTTPAPTSPSQDAAPTTKEITVADSPDTLSPEDVASLRSLASVAPQLAALLTERQTAPVDSGPQETGPVLVPDAPADDEGREFTDEEIAAMAASLPDEDVATPEMVAASHSDDSDGPGGSGPSETELALSQQLREAQEAGRDRDLRLAQVEDELAERRFGAESERWAREFGIHPRITAIIKPILKGPGVGQIALSHGGPRVDVAETVRKFALELARSEPLDLSQTAGSPLDVDDAVTAEQAERDAFLAQARVELGR